MQHVAVRNVLAGAHIAHGSNNLLGLGHSFQGIAVNGLSLGQDSIHDALTILAVADVLPQLLADEWHERMDETQQHVEESQRCIHRGAIDGLLVGWLDNLKIESREIFPEEFIDRHQRLVEAELGK